MSVEYYVRFTGSDGQHLLGDAGGQWFAVSDADYGGQQSLDIGATGAGAGKVSFDPLSLTLGASSATEKLDQLLASGTLLKSIELVGYDSGVKVSSTVFKTAGLTSDTIDVVTGAHALTFAYGAVVESAATFDQNGKVSGAQTLGWDEVRNVADNVTPNNALQHADDPTGTSAGPIEGNASDNHRVFLQIRNADGSIWSDLGDQWIEVDSASVAQLQTLDIAAQSSGAGEGKVTFDPLELTMHSGALGPQLDYKLASGTAFQVELAVYDYNGSGNALVDDYQFGLASFASHTLTDGTQSYTLNYGSERMAHTVLDANGTASRVAVEGWNRVRNVEQTTAGTASGGFDNQHAPNSQNKLTIHATHEGTEYYVRFTGSDGQALHGDDGGQWFEVPEAAYGSLQTLNISDPGAGAGKATFEPLSLTLGASALTEKLDQMLESGTALKTVELLGYANGVKVSSTVFKLAAPASDQIDVSTGAHALTFGYGSVVESVAVDKSGTLASVRTQGWDTVKNVADNTTPNDALQHADDPGGSNPGPIERGGIVNAGDHHVYLQIRNADGSALAGFGSQWITLDAAVVSQLQTANIGAVGTGAATGRVEFNPLELKFAAGALGPVLDQKLAAGGAFQVEIAVYGNSPTGSPTSGTLIDDYQFGLAGFSAHTTDLSDAGGEQSYTLEYGSERVAHNVLGTNQQVISTTVEGWNRVTNTQQTAANTARGGFDSQHAPTNASTLSVTAPQYDANEYFVRFTGSDGQVLQGDAGGQWFRVPEGDYGSLQTLDIGPQSTGTGAGTVDFAPLSLTIGASTLTEKLDQLLQGGIALKSIELVAYTGQATQETKLSSTVFKTAAATSDSIDMVTGAHSLTFQYNAVVESVANFSSPGQLAGVTTAGWDQVKNAADNVIARDASQHPDDPYVNGSSRGVLENPGIGERSLYLQIRNADGSPLSGLGAQWIQVDAATVSQLQTLTIGSTNTGAGAGKVSFNPLELTFAPGALGPLLDQELASGGTFQVELAEYSNANAQTAGILINDYQFGLAALASHTLAGGTQGYTLEYGSERMAHTVITQQGTAGATIVEGWNGVRNVQQTTADTANGGFDSQRAPTDRSKLTLYTGGSYIPPTTPATPVAPTLANDTGVAGDHVTADPTISYPAAAHGATLLYALDGGAYTTTAPLITGSGQHTVSVEQVASGLTSGAASLTFTLHASQAITGHDLNGDDFGDVAFRNASGLLASWQIGASGALTGGGTIGNPGAVNRLVASGDLDGDGRTDLIFRARDGSIATWLLNGTAIASGATIGNPGARYAVLGTGDFNGDGRSDILFRDASSGAYASWDMNGAAIVGGATIGNPGAQYVFKAVADFDGDGKTDLLFQKADGSYALWLLNDATIVSGGTLGNPGAGYFFKGVGDFNGDGHTDVLFEKSDVTYATWDLNGAHIIGGGVLGNPGGSYSFAQIGDFNGDGKSDILFRNTDGSFATWTLDDTTITGGTNLGSPGGSFTTATGQGASDFGHLVFQDSTTSTVAGWTIGGGTAIVASGTIGTPGAAWVAVGTGDFAGSGEVDVLFHNTSTNAYATFASNGTTSIGGSPLGSLDASWSVKAIADFNGDGHSDVLFQNANGTYGTWDVSGSKIVGGGTLGVAAGYSFAGAGDIDGDGRADIVFEDAAGNYAAWRVSDTTIVGGGTIGNPGAGWTMKGMGDFNGDGKADILFENNAGHYATWDLDGISIIGGGDIGTPGGTFQLVKIADLNADGRSDLLFEDATGHLASWTLADTAIIGGGNLGVLPSNYHLV